MQKRHMRAALKRQAYETLKALILSGELKPGDALLEDELGPQFGLSRTPIREILRQLAQDRLVKHNSYVGTYVTQLTREDVREIYEIRGFLEALAVRTAVALISDRELEEMEQVYHRAREELGQAKTTGALNEFRGLHDLLVAHSNNLRLQAIVRALEIEWQRIGSIVTQSPDYDAEPALNEKYEILCAVRDRDADRAAHLIVEHYARSVHVAGQFLPDRSAVPEILLTPTQPSLLNISLINACGGDGKKP